MSSHRVSALRGNGVHLRPSTADLATLGGTRAERLPLIRGIELLRDTGPKNDVPLVRTDTVVRGYAEKTFAGDPDPEPTAGLVAREDAVPVLPNCKIGHSARHPNAHARNECHGSVLRADPSGNKILEIGVPTVWTTGDVILTLTNNQPPYEDLTGGVTCMWGHETDGTPRGQDDLHGHRQFSRSICTSTVWAARDRRRMTWGGATPARHRASLQDVCATVGGIEPQFSYESYPYATPLSADVLQYLWHKRESAQGEKIPCRTERSPTSTHLPTRRTMTCGA